MVARSCKSSSAVCRKLLRICRGNLSAESTSLTNTTARLPMANGRNRFKGDHYLLAVDYFSRHLPITRFQRFFRAIMVHSLLPKNFPSLQSHTGSTILPAVQVSTKLRTSGNDGTDNQKIAEKFSRPSSSSTVIQGHTYAVVWIEPIRIVYEKEDKDHYSSGDEATNSKLVISP